MRMRFAKLIVALILSVSVAAAGIPVQAASACPMAAMTKAAKAGQADEPGQARYDKTANSPTKPGGCCTDPGCSAKCSALSGGISIDLPAMGAALPAPDGRRLRLHPMADALASLLRHPQERPPKLLA